MAQSERRGFPAPRPGYDFSHPPFNTPETVVFPAPLPRRAPRRPQRRINSELTSPAAHNKPLARVCIGKRIIKLLVPDFIIATVMTVAGSPQLALGARILGQVRNLEEKD
ncbi:hypothetical protein EVAR_26555_1 [Eumeta japonica]|uniref:Uncharacterized protein n=1 Tax=Eumeta variegata TaxID=151549 RepID=A0A4C1W5D9_EUMVA|nr:hypothetical protein EVAR_26555_1 [Eumeta japonica]